jgi:hypothetical protein
MDDVTVVTPDLPSCCNVKLKFDLRAPPRGVCVEGPEGKALLRKPESFFVVGRCILHAAVH